MWCFPFSKHNPSHVNYKDHYASLSGWIFHLIQWRCVNFGTFQALPQTSAIVYIIFFTSHLITFLLVYSSLYLPASQCLINVICAFYSIISCIFYASTWCLLVYRPEICSPMSWERQMDAWLHCPSAVARHITLSHVHSHLLPLSPLLAPLFKFAFLSVSLSSFCYCHCVCGLPFSP